MAMGTSQDRSGNWECLICRGCQKLPMYLPYSVILQSLRSVYGLHTAHFRPVILWCNRVVGLLSRN